MLGCCFERLLKCSSNTPIAQLSSGQIQGGFLDALIYTIEKKRLESDWGLSTLLNQLEFSEATLRLRAGIFGIREALENGAKRMRLLIPKQPRARDSARELTSTIWARVITPPRL